MRDEQTMLDRLEKLIRARPGLTATQLAEKLFGIEGYHERVAGACRTLVRAGKAERHGAGGPGHPYTYYPAAARNSARNDDARPIQAEADRSASRGRQG